MGKNVFKIDERNLWREKRARFDRFGFEVLPDDADELTDDDDLSYGQVFRTVFSLLVIVFIGYAGLIIYERLNGFSLASLFERKIDESAFEILAPEPEIKATKQFPSPEVPAEPEFEPQKRLFNPDGTMKASFPLPPGGRPKIITYPGRKPARRPNPR